MLGKIYSEKKMIEPPKEIHIEEFKYFIVVKDMMVAGVYAEDDDNVYAILLKGDAYPVGSTTGCPKHLLSKQVQAGITTIVLNHEEAMAVELGNVIPDEVNNFNKDEEDES
jgi:hypothetical protein